MTETLKEFNFRKIIEEYGHLRVPEIQRDYAEGRKNQKVVDIRKSFLSVLMQVISGAKDKEHLDFIYGNIRDNAFEPLDGQQRLTTLFLLSWFFAPEECDDLKDENGASVFTYETRTTAKEFCNELVKHSASQLYRKLKTLDCTTKFSEVMTSRAWFKWSWNYDPTVVSMLTVLDSVVEIIDDESTPYKYSTSYYDNVKHVMFHRLKLSELGISDSLYVKMNARGKILSDFDILKSTLEEEIQFQKQESIANAALEELWRTHIDGMWIDYCWDKYTAKCDSLDKVKVEQVEIKFRQILQRLIALQLAKKTDMPNNVLWTLCCNTYQRELDRVIPIYVEDLFNYRHHKGGTAQVQVPALIDFQGILGDFDSILYKDSFRKWHDITECIPFGIEPEKREMSLMDLFLEPSFSRSTQVIFYALLEYNRKCPAEEIVKDKSKLDDFCNWIRFVRNTLLISNNNARIDKPYKSVEAMDKVDELLDEFFASGKSMLDYLQNVKEGQQFAKERVEEERVKASLRHDEEWDRLVLRAEAQPMLWGQICSLLDWSKMDDGNYDKKMFTTYLSYLERVLNETETLDMNKVYRGLLCIRDYRYDNCLLKFSRERDRSWKRYLREYSTTYAPILKELIDIWKSEIPETKTFAECLDYLYDSRKNSVKDWRHYVIENPEMLTYAYDKMIFENDGHFYVAQLKTRDSHCKEILLDYIESKILNGNLPKDVTLLLHDTKDNNDRNSLTWDDYKLQVIAKGAYRLTMADKILCESGDCDEIVLKVKEVQIVACHGNTFGNGASTHA